MVAETAEERRLGAGSPNNPLLLAVLIACMLIGCDVRSRKSYQVRVTTDGTGPDGQKDPEWNGPDSVVLYRTGLNGVVCFDFFRSKELHDRLMAKNEQLVTAEYDTFSDFGKVRAYNVHAVDGIILANGYHGLRDDFAASAGVIVGSKGTCFWR
jgi:hypothetical protein